MKQLNLGLRSLAVAATSSALAFAVPPASSAALPAYAQRGPSHSARPLAVRLPHLGLATRTGAGGPVFDLAAGFDPTLVRTQAAVSPPPGPAPGSMGPNETPAAVKSRRCAGDVACFLVCTRADESDGGDANGNGMFDGGYDAVGPGGFRGAYQFLPSTWDSTARAVGRDDLVGVDPATASPGDQDQLAAALYGAAGNRPWGGRC